MCFVGGDVSTDGLGRRDGPLSDVRGEWYSVQ